jgi:hypothetical protein
MVWHIDLDRHEIARARDFTYPVETVTLKARDSFVIDLYFSRAGVAVDLPTGSVIVFAIKASVASAAITYALATGWTLVEVGSGHYQTRINLNTATTVADIADLPSIDAVGEVSWSEDEIEWESSNTLKVTIVNDVYKGVEGTPIELPAPVEWLEDQLDAILAALNITKYADLATANAALGIGKPYYDEELNTINITTA